MTVGEEELVSPNDESADLFSNTMWACLELYIHTNNEKGLSSLCVYIYKDECMYTCITTMK